MISIRGSEKRSSDIVDVKYGQSSFTMLICRILNVKKACYMYVHYESYIL